MHIQIVPMVTLLNLASWHRRQRDNAVRVRKRTKNNNLRVTLAGEIDRFDGIYNVIADEIDRRINVNSSVSVPPRGSRKERRNEASAQLKSHQSERRTEAA